MASLSFFSLQPLPLPNTTTSSNPTLSLLNHRSSDSFKLVLTTRRKTRRSRGGGAVCYAPALGPQTLQWVSAVSSGRSQAGAVISLTIAGYLAFQHFSRAGSLRRAFDQVSVIATLAIICITVVSCLFCF